MSTILSTVENVTGLVRRDNESSLVIHYQSEGETRAICFPRNVISDLLVGLAGMQAPQSGQPIDIPAILANHIVPFQQSDCSGLAVYLSGGWVLPIAIPESSLPGMKKTIADLELLSAVPKGRA